MTAMKPVLLFAPETLNIAETTRMIEIARACSEDFDCRFFGYGGAFEHLIVDAGFPVTSLEPRLTPERVDELWKADRMEIGGLFFTKDELVERVRNELALYARCDPVAVVIGFCFSVYISARAAKLPLVAAAPFSFTRPFFKAGLGTWPDALDFPPISWIPQGLLDPLFNLWGLRTRMWTRPMNEAAAVFGVPPWHRLVDLFEADHMLITGVPAITGVPELPPPYHYVGPIYARLDVEIPEAILRMPRDRPVIWCAMGSSADQEVLVETLKALAQLPVRVIAPVKAHLEGVELNLPDHIMIVDWLPSHRVNPMADISVIHGGEGTVQTAAISGTPFVGIGLQPEQETNIEFMVRQGCAVRLRKDEVDAETLADAIEYLLHDPWVRRNADRVREILRDWDGPENCAVFMRERFLDASAGI